MKSEKGITLISLITYVIIMSIVLLIMTGIINQFYKNTDSIQASTEEIVKLGQLNTYFLKEIKKQNNGIDTINQNYIVFKTGNTFTYNNHRIFYNQVLICDNIKDFSFSSENEKIVSYTAKLENFEKTMTYKIEEIY